MAEVDPSDTKTPPLPELALPLPATEGAARFAFIDALRGIAAFVVMIYHFYTTGPLHGVYESYFPDGANSVVAKLNAGVLIFFVGRLGRLHSLLNWRWLQLLGAISYGTYLLHEVIGVRVINLGFRFTRDRVAIAWMLMPLGIACTLIAAWLMRRFVEAPFIHIAKRFKHVRGATPRDRANLSPAKSP